MNNHIFAIMYKLFKTSCEKALTSRSIIILVYILLTLYIKYIIEPPEQITVIFTLPLIVLIPIEIGKIVLFTFEWHLNANKYIDIHGLVRLIVEWGIGIYMMVLSAGFFSIVLKIKIGYYILPIYLFIILFNVIIDIFITQKDQYIINQKQLYENLISLLIVAIISITPMLLTKEIQPFPLIMTHEYVYIDNMFRVADGTIDYLDMGMLGYSNHMIEGIIFMLYALKPLSLWSSMPFLFIALFGTGLYLFTLEKFGSRATSYFIVFITVWLWNVGAVANSFHLIVARTWLYIYFVFFLYVIQKEIINENKIPEIKTAIISVAFFLILFLQKRIYIIQDNLLSLVIFSSMPLIGFLLIKFIKVSDRPAFLLMTSFSIFSIVLHSFEAMFYNITIWSYVYISSAYTNKQKLIMYASRGFVFFTMLFILVQKLNILNFTNNFIVTQYLFGSTYDNLWFNIDFHGKYALMQDNITNAMMMIMVLVFIILVMKKDAKIAPILTIASVGLFLYFSPEGFFVRISYAIPFIGITIGYGLIKLIFTKQNVDTKPNLSRLLKILVIVVLVTSISIIPLNSQVESYKINDKMFSTFSEDEYKTAYLIYEISKGSDEKALLISDPYTLFFISSLSHNYIPMKRSWVYVGEMEANSIHVAEFLKNDFFSIDQPITLPQINEIKKSIYNRNINVTSSVPDDLDIYIIVSPRTSKWLNSDEIFVLEYGTFSTDVDKKITDKFNESQFFSLMYEKNNMFIYKNTRDVLNQ